MPEPRSVFVIAPKFYPETAGYAHAITGLIRSIRENYPELKISVLTMSRDNRKEISLPEYLKGVEIKRGCQDGIHRYLFEWANLLYAWRRFRAYDVIFFETADLFILGLFASLVSRHKIIIREQGCWSSEIIRFKDSLIFRICRVLVGRHYRQARVLAPTTKYYNRFVLQHYFKHNEYTAAGIFLTCIPNTTYLQPRDLSAERTTFAEKNQLPENSRWFLTLGRQDLDGLLQKGFEDLIHSFHRLKQDVSSGRPWHLIVLGDGSHHRRLVDLASELGLSENVSFIQSLPHEEVIFYTHHADVIALCSRFEGMSMFATESLAMGKPVIFTNTGGLQGMVRHAINGYCPEPGDLESITSSLKELLKKTNDDLVLMGQESRRHFEENYSPSIACRQFIQALDLTR